MLYAAYFRNLNFNSAVLEKKLSELKPGEAGVIQNFSDEEIKLKLMEMGCIPGETVLMERVTHWEIQWQLKLQAISLV